MRRKVKIRVPGTCGELIQTVYLGRECLVSLPIDRYHYIEAFLVDECASECHNPITSGNINGLNGNKALEAVEVIGSHLQIGRDWLNKLRFKSYGNLKVGIGMASSTADVYGVMAAIAELREAVISDEDYGLLCSKIEPTDGIMFEHWTLFDHLNGEILSRSNIHKTYDLLVFECEEFIDTIHMREEATYLEKLAAKSDEPLRLYQEFVGSGNGKTLGAASTSSILENNIIIPKSGVLELILIGREIGALGVVGAHSGSLIGLLFEKRPNMSIEEDECLEDESLEELSNDLKQWQQVHGYNHHYWCKTTSGGYTLMEWED